MDFLQGFLLNSASGSLEGYLKKYDKKNGTHYALTTNLQNARIHMVKGMVMGILKRSQLLETLKDSVKVKERIDLVIEVLLESLIFEKKEKKFVQLLREISEKSPKKCVALLLYISGALWQAIGIYDEDANYFTRRATLAALLTNQIMTRFDAVIYLPVN